MQRPKPQRLGLQMWLLGGGGVDLVGMVLVGGGLRALVVVHWASGLGLRTLPDALCPLVQRAVGWNPMG